MQMKRLACISIAAGLAASVAGTTTWAWDDDDDYRDGVERFVTLPSGVRFPEGITANPSNGDIFVATFDFGAQNKLLRYSRHGRLIAQVNIDGPLLGLAFDALHSKVYLTRFGSGAIQRIAANFNDATVPETVVTLPTIGAPGPRSEGNPDGSSDTTTFGFSGGALAPNAMEFDQLGRLYVSDSFQGAVFRIESTDGCAPTCPVTTVMQDPLLATAGFPPFGANGLALDRTETTLFIANTGDDRVLKLDLSSNTLTVFTESINGADGLLFDRKGRLWVAANQSDEVVALNKNGRVIKRIGRFEGIRNGAPKGLLFPASLVIVDHDMYVTNLSLPLTPAVGDEPEEDVTRWTISRIRLDD
jgi:DNA-binding beta-propeller fold protein YncE